jgi:hypothetical protein
MYLYVSDEKVDMLIGQMGRSVVDRFNLKVTAPFVSAEVNLRPQPQAGRFARAEHLCEALAAEGRVGSILDQGTEFFRGQMLATWGFWNRHNKGYADVVFFSGFVEENTLVGLGGSAYHTIERSGDRMQQRSNSGIQTLMAFLKECSEETGAQSSDKHDPLPVLNAEVWDADHDNPCVPEAIEFVAQRLFDDADGDVRTIIGSPIYVARTGQPTTRQMLKDYQTIRDRHAVRLYGKRRLKRRHGHWEIGKPSDPRPIPSPDADLI